MADRKKRQPDDKSPVDASIPLAEEGPQKTFTPASSRPASIVPSTGIAGRSLTFVIAAMCFLACLFFATMISSQRTADRWADQISAQVTVQVLPDASSDIDTQVATVIGILEATPGIDEATDTPASVLQDMLAPWLGSGFAMNELPIPRMIQVAIDTDNPPDFEKLADAVLTAVPNAEFDDHRFWDARLTTGARTATIIGGLLFLLVLAVMVACVVFATRGTMSGNREVIEVLHFVGAPEQFIAAEFQRHFLVLGLRAGLIGGLAAMAILTLLSTFLARWVDAQQATEVRILFGDFGVGLLTLIGISIIVALVAGLTAVTTRVTVFRYLHSIQ